MVESRVQSQVKHVLILGEQRPSLSKTLRRKRYRNGVLTPCVFDKVEVEAFHDCHFTICERLGGLVVEVSVRGCVSRSEKYSRADARLKYL
jgi:hypothetical protein